MELQAHDLHAEFPEFRDAIHALKVGNAHFARLFDQYHDVNKHVQRVETEVEVASDQFVEELKKQRLKLKDELYAMIRGWQPA